MAIAFVDSGEGYPLRTLLIRTMGDTGKDLDIPLLNEPCDVMKTKRCRRPEASRQIAKANGFLSKHRWARIACYLPRHPSQGTVNACSGEDLNRHFRIPGFEVNYEIVDPSKGAHLRIVREDGAVITDTDVDVHDPGESEECRRGTMPYINDLGFDLERRAMYVDLNPCDTEGCPGGVRVLFFRLPPPLPKAAGNATPIPKR